MSRFFLSIYVSINIIIVLANIVVNLFSKNTVHFLDNNDWLTFIIACSALAIVESLAARKPDPFNAVRHFMRKRQ